MQDEALLTIEDLSALLRVPVRTIYWWRQQRPPIGPPAVKLGRHLRWRRETVLAWIESQEDHDG